VSCIKSNRWPGSHGQQDEKLKGYNQWRVRVGDWRIVYIIDDKEKLVSVTRIAHRREVYE
jgi:mRNA-degrading endonuclease RelE of RelBE toxin-antitoxin system